ncbi:riboflavin biosynthesis protein RibF [Muribaculum sp.]|uniref:riboflavin biosynthesis protein RibF n=1 Tax=Muribaculum sp. TaxID=1918611 RepID=UPI0023CA0836|nr:riboflavin biosynthesis protein RibF [Muribaculum sp.]MDE5706399.1 riboflavin biosynthesis protein RibF [Muribaculum sp.]
MLITAQYDHTHRRMATIGTFDGVHLGHRALLSQLISEARKAGLIPAAVTFTAHPRRKITPAEAPMMLMSPQQRAEAIMSAGVDDVILLDFDEKMRHMSAREFLELLHTHYDVDALLMGFNNSFGHDRPKGLDAYRAIGEETGIRIIGAAELTVEGCCRVCSSEAREMLLQARPDEAARLLGAPYRIIGRVVHGKELGRTIGFPTANIKPLATECLIPANGVYAAAVTLADGTTYPAMLNIGHRPSVDTPLAPVSIEAHILGFDGDIYGTTVAVDFLHYMRRERKFPSIEALRRQLVDDAAAVLEISELKDMITPTCRI